MGNQQNSTASNGLIDLAQKNYAETGVHAADAVPRQMPAGTAGSVQQITALVSDVGPLRSVPKHEYNVR